MVRQSGEIGGNYVQVEIFYRQIASAILNPHPQQEAMNAVRN